VTDVPPVLVGTFFAVLGLMVGSFLNVCIYRLPLKQSIAWPASRCTSCERPLTWFENVPVVAWLALNGRCRTCQTAISPMYPIIELVTGALFVGGYVLYGATPLGFVRITFGCAMIVLFVIDLRHRILPNIITVTGVPIGFALSLFLPPGWRESLIGLLLGGGVLFVIGEAYYRVRGIDGLGMGDVKMLAMIGAFLGWRLTLVTLIFASFTGALVGVAMLASGRGGMKAALPFGSFLAVGAVVAVVAGDPLFNWYVSLYR
jgi:leader peptidase (prepilin peptidase) / N-methyltransferase